MLLTSLYSKEKQITENSAAIRLLAQATGPLWLLSNGAAQKPGITEDLLLFTYLIYIFSSQGSSRQEGLSAIRDCQCILSVTQQPASSSSPTTFSCCLRHPGEIAGICIVEAGSLCFPWVLFLPSHLLFLLLCSHFLLHLISCIVCAYQPLLFCRLCQAYRPSLITDGQVSLYCRLEGSHCMPSPLNFPFPRVSTPIIVSTQEPMKKVLGNPALFSWAPAPRYAAPSGSESG